MHRPIAPCTILQLALAGHFEDDSQLSAQRLGLLAPCVSSAHSGLALVPAGTSVGHAAPLAHDGEQKPPLTPRMVTSISPDWHAPADLPRHARKIAHHTQAMPQE